MMSTTRQAQQGDLEAVARLFDAYRQFYGYAADLAGARSFLQARLQAGDSVILLAENPSGTLCGLAQLYPLWSSLQMLPVLLLNDLYVAPEARSQGLGAALLAASEAHGRAVGAAYLILQTAVTNHPAQRLYERAGWVRDSQFLTYEKPLG